jgi:hypothetical protein
MNRFTVDTDLRCCDILSGALVILNRHRDGEKTTHGRQCGSECNDPKKFVCSQSFSYKLHLVLDRQESLPVICAEKSLRLPDT